jgi:hypothetical protein
MMLAVTLILQLALVTESRAETSEAMQPTATVVVRPPPPTATAEPTAAPTATFVPTAPPIATEVPTAAPTATEVAVPLPTATEAPTAAPTATESTTPTPTISGAASPEVVELVAAETTVSLQVNEANTQFGQVSASDEPDPAIGGLASAVDDGGAYYVRTNAIELTVTASGTWRGACFASASAGRLEWRLSGTATWAPFSEAGADGQPGSSCFPPGVAGQHTFTYDLRLRVAQGDPPGLFAATIVFGVEG